KSQLVEKEVEAAEDHDISLLNSRATCLASILDDAKVACVEAGNKITSLASERDRLASKDFKERMETQQEEQAHELYNRVAELKAHVMDVFGHLEGEFYPTYMTTLAGRRWLLTYGIQLALLKCLKSPKYQGTLGHALGRAVDFGMQEGLEAGYEHGTAGINLSAFDAYNPEVARASYINAVKALEDVDFPLVNLLKSKKDAGIDEVLDCFQLDRPLAESRAEHELELKKKLRAKYTARSRLLEEKDLEILKLKSQLAEKEVEAAENHDISLLNSHATCLASTLDDAKVACAEVGKKITSLASERDRLASEVSSMRAGF
ncbi:hypothetical protein Tco_1407463, partial [Tanacetum coccineum]